MELTLTPLKDFSEIFETFPIYKDCMYMPTEEKFRSKLQNYLKNGNIKFFAAREKGILTGVLALSQSGKTAEIIGIAVDPAHRGKGTGSFMINTAAKELGVSELYAETDSDAVGFYRKSGFETREFTKEYDGEKITRFSCRIKFLP